MKHLWRSGFIFTAANLLVGFGNLAFQSIIGHYITKPGEYGLVNSTLGLYALLALPVSIATQAVTHYIARFKFTGDETKLQGLLAGCHQFLLRLTIIGSVLAVFLVKPIGDFFHISRPSLVAIALFCVLAGLWGGFVTALCQGLAWFRRLALICVLTVVLRLVWGGLIWKFPTAEWAVAATGVSLFSFAIVLFWRKDLTWSVAAVSPWDRHFVVYLIVAAALTGGTYCFSQGDLLVAQRHFGKAQMDAYSGAGVLARALSMAVAPLLTILFTHRSASHAHDEESMRQQFKLLGLYTLGLICGATGLLILRTSLLALIGRNTPGAGDMMGPLAWTMVFAGLLQGLGMWALASRWIKISLLYGGLGVAYWLVLLAFGDTPEHLLLLMPLVAAGAFGVLFVVWIKTLIRTHPGRGRKG